MENLIINRKQLSEILSVSDTTIKKYEKIGLKTSNVVKKGVSAEYDLKDVIDFIREFERDRVLKELTNGGGAGVISDENANIELLKNRAEKEYFNIEIARQNSEIKRITKDKLLNNLIEQQHVKTVIIDLFLVLKSIIETLPQGLSLSLVGKSEREIKDIIKIKVNKILEQMSSDDIIDKIIELNSDNNVSDDVEEVKDEENQ